MLNNMLAKMASKMKPGSGANMEQSGAPMVDENIDPNEKDAAYKSAAVLAHFQPMLQQKLKEKDPAKYDEFMKGYADINAQMIDFAKKGRYGDMTKKQQEAKEYAANNAYDVYLNQDDLKKALGEHYDTYMDAVKVNNMLFGKKKLAGEKENPSTVEDLLYGRRMATQTMLIGEDASLNGKPDYAKFYKYDPKTKTSVIDESRSFNYKGR